VVQRCTVIRAEYDHNSLYNKLFWKTRNAWQSIVYSPLGAPIANTNDTHTYWSPPCLAAPPPTERTWSHPRKIFDADCTTSYVLILKLLGHRTESHQISTRSTEMISYYSAEIKIAIFQSVWKRQRDEWRSSSNCRRIAANIARFNSVNSEITDGSSPNLEAM